METKYYIDAYEGMAVRTSGNDVYLNNGKEEWKVAYPKGKPTEDEMIPLRLVGVVTKPQNKVSKEEYTAFKG